MKQMRKSYRKDKIVKKTVESFETLCVCVCVCECVCVCICVWVFVCGSQHLQGRQPYAWVAFLHDMAVLVLALEG